MKIAREFFELFKTPWEFFSPHKYYDVLISTTPELPENTSKCVILFSSEAIDFDKTFGINIESHNPCRLSNASNTKIPIYCNLSTFNQIGTPILRIDGGNGVTAVNIQDNNQNYLRVGFDLFKEIEFLLSTGQSTENSMIPTLDLHISTLRDWILGAGIPLVEIPPIPYGYQMSACLTHDVDFVGIRQHKFDHTMWGFLYRAVISSFVRFIQGKYTLSKLIKNWAAVLSLPLVYLGIIQDFWDEFERYAAIEKDHLSTFFFIPYKGFAGEKGDSGFSLRRAAQHDLENIKGQILQLNTRGFEIGLHGIDAWHDPQKARKEFERIADITGQTSMGVRMHWLYYDQNSPAVLENAGFDYDSTVGYNNAIGYRAGTAQVYKPIGAERLLEIPLHIQDSALFYPGRMALTDSQAWELAGKVLNATQDHGGVITILWHTRSLSPERLWGDFYLRLLDELRRRSVWIGHASQIVAWFQQRRSITYENCSIINNKLSINVRINQPLAGPGMTLRIYIPQQAESRNYRGEYTFIDFRFTGERSFEYQLD